MLSVDPSLTCRCGSGVKVPKDGLAKVNSRCCKDLAHCKLSTAYARLVWRRFWAGGIYNKLISTL